FHQPILLWLDNPAYSVGTSKALFLFPYASLYRSRYYDLCKPRRNAPVLLASSSLRKHVARDRTVRYLNRYRLPSSDHDLRTCLDRYSSLVVQLRTFLRSHRNMFRAPERWFFHKACNAVLRAPSCDGGLYGAS